MQTHMGQVAAPIGKKRSLRINTEPPALGKARTPDIVNVKISGTAATPGIIQANPKS